MVPLPPVLDRPMIHDICIALDMSVFFHKFIVWK